MAENLNQKPKRGILKASTSFEQGEHDPNGGAISQSTSFDQREHDPNRVASNTVTKIPHFDEMNIIATLHPADKDYGFMKIDEPKTPYERCTEEDELVKEEDKNNLDPSVLAAKIASEGHKGPRQRKISEPSSVDDEEYKTPEERERRKSFEQKRKQHYNNEFVTWKSIEEQITDDEEEDENKMDVASSSS